MYIQVTGKTGTTISIYKTCTHRYIQTNLHTYIIIHFLHRMTKILYICITNKYRLLKFRSVKSCFLFFLLTITIFYSPVKADFPKRKGRYYILIIVLHNYNQVQGFWEPAARPCKPLCLSCRSMAQVSSFLYFVIITIPL